MVRSPTNEVTNGWRLVKLQDRILVAEQSMTKQPKGSHDLQNSTLTLTGQAIGEAQFYQLTCIYKIILTVFFKLVFWETNSQKLFILKIKRVNCVEKNKTLNILVITINCIWWLNSSSGFLGMWSTNSLRLLPVLLLSGVVEPVRDQSKGQIELFNHLLRIINISYLKL